MDRAELGKARPWELWSIPEPQFLQLSAGRSLEWVEQVCLVSIYVFLRITGFLISQLKAACPSPLWFFLFPGCLRGGRQLLAFGHFLRARHIAGTGDVLRVGKIGIMF